MSVFSQHELFIDDMLTWGIKQVGRSLVNRASVVIISAVALTPLASSQSGQQRIAGIGLATTDSSSLSCGHSPCHCPPLMTAAWVGVKLPRRCELRAQALSRASLVP